MSGRSMARAKAPVSRDPPPPGASAGQARPVVFRGMNEVQALVTEPAVVLIREVGLVKNRLQLKGMANSDTRINEPARVPFQQLSLTERSWDGSSIDCPIAGRTG